MITLYNIILLVVGYYSVLQIHIESLQIIYLNLLPRELLLKTRLELTFMKILFKPHSVRTAFIFIAEGE